MQSILAWIWAPVVMFAVCLGLGLLLEAATRHRPDPALLAPLGFAVALVLVTPLYMAHLHAGVAAVVLVVLAVAGFALRRGELGRLRPGPALAAGAAAFLLYLAPTAFSGSWTWAGYNFTNDPANTLSATWWILHHGFTAPADPQSTTGIISKSSIDLGYPLGAHLVAGTFRPLVGVPLIALYQSYMAFVMALAAAALTRVARAAGLHPLAAIVAAVAAVGANLLYVYGQLGGVKELAVVALLATAAGIAAQLSPGRWTIGVVATAVVPLAAIVPVYSAGGVAYAGLLAVAVAAVAVPDRGRRPLRALLVSAALGAVLFAVLSGPALAPAIRFGSSVNANLSISPLGQLLRPLPLGQVGGVWWAQDWRLPVPHGTLASLNNLILVVVFVALVIGVVSMVRRRAAVLVGLAAVAVAIAVIGPGTTPYGESKLLIIASPFVVLTAGLGVWAIGRRIPLAGIAAGLLIVGGVAYSDAITYRQVRLAPIDRMRAMDDIARAAHGKGLVLDYEWEEWSKYFMRGAQVKAAEEVYLGQGNLELRRGIVALAQRYDLDDVKLKYIESFPAIVSRRGPETSRPPANYRLVHRNRYYDLWVRDRRTEVAGHLPIQGLFTSQVRVPCSRIERFARRARPGDTLVAPTRPANVVLQPALSPHSPGWVPSGVADGTLTPNTPGKAYGRMPVPAGRYRVWIYGSTGRPIQASVDGHPVGRLDQVNTPGQWVALDAISLRRGMHMLEITRPGGSLAPGDSFKGILGPLALEPIAPTTMQRVRPSQVRRLCGRALDWVEIVRAARRP
ncbi:MAG: hypothetical protein ACXVVU_20845 [Solirubrobacteraceae bacterium]